MNKKVKTTSIKSSSRCSVKVGDTFYTIEYTEERSVDSSITDKELKAARNELWDCVNAEVDNQIEDILKMYKK